mgnify:FL=1
MKFTKWLFIGIMCCFIVACTDKEIFEDVGPEEPGEPVTPEEDTTEPPVGNVPEKRMLWASINGRTDATASTFSKYNDKILVSWRFFPTDTEDTAFDLYRAIGNGEEVKLNSEPIVATTCFQDIGADRMQDNIYRLCYSGSTETLDTYTMSSYRASQGLPYISIPLAHTVNIDPRRIYAANDASVGDLDGDGEYEIVLKRLLDDATGEDKDSNTRAVDMGVTHFMLLEAYKMDGTFMWRIKLGPNVLTGNGSSFAVYDFDGDGRCEIALRTAEGTVFGDGKEIGDTDGDGKTDYRVSGANYIHGGPEFLSVIEGTTGKELARTDYIGLGSSEEWGDDYYKRSSSYRIGVAKCTQLHTNIIIGRGCYAKIVVEAWTFVGGKLMKEWRFDTTDGKHGAYEGQGYHSMRTGDVDGDGLDEIVYGSMTVDHTGLGLNNCGMGHGDAIHLGKFDPSREGLQIWACYETGATGAAFRDARTGKVIWKYLDSDDVGRCMVADIDPDSPGCEMWWYKGNAHSPSGEDLGYAPGYCNMAIWWSGLLNRELLDKTVIDNSRCGGRFFSLHRYGVVSINSSKANPCFYGDIVGDWREEIIMPTADNRELRLFSSWYPSDYRFPYLMSDHVYEMSALNENIGYNQPTHIGYYLGSDLDIKRK